MRSNARSSSKVRQGITVSPVASEASRQHGKAINSENRIKATQEQRRESLHFNDNQLASELFGALGQHVTLIESLLNLQIAIKGSQIEIEGTDQEVSQAVQAFQNLWSQLGAGYTISEQDIRAAVAVSATNRQTSGQNKNDQAGGLHTRNLREIPPVITTPRRKVQPRTPSQAVFMAAMARSRLTFGIGPAGVGKTWLAVAQGLEAMANGVCRRLVLTRPAVEAGERLGFLPGDMKEKIDPYLTPIYDALNDFLPEGQVGRRMSAHEIEIAPLAFMRGRSLRDCFIILDEAQNATPSQMKMLLTRIGENSRMVVNGDLTQVDLPAGVLSGLRHARSVLKDLEEISFVEFSSADVVRDPLTAKIVTAYEQADKS